MIICAIIPARGGSKGIPRKNIAPLGGKPLIAWTVEAARAARSIARVVVSTDDDEIAAVARAAGAEVPFLRPAEIANDTAPALPVIQHALGVLASNEGWSPDAVAYLQPTSPFRHAGHIDGAARVLDERGADTVVSVVRVPHNMTPSSQMTENDGWLQFAAPQEPQQLRRQDKGASWARNGPAVLLVRRATIDAGQLYGARIAPFEMSRLCSIDIDDREDLRLAEAVIPLIEENRRLGGDEAG